MALSADQRALLELLLHKGQGYDDIASLLDVPEAEVRSRARWALAALGDADPDRNVALTDWLLGQADPIGRADAARRVREDPDDYRLAASLIASLRELAPDADLPKLPAEPGGGGRFLRRGASEEAAPAKPAPAPAGAATPAAPGAGRLSSLTQQQTRMIVALGSAALILVVVVLAITGAFGGGDDGSTQASATTTATDGTTTGDSEIQTIKLRPSGGGDAEGTATFGIASGQQAYVDLDVSNLEPAPNGEAYILWLMVSEDQGHPLTPFQAEGGTYSERIPIASFLTELAARTRFVDVSLAESEPLLKKVQAAVNDGTPVIGYTGESIMRGEVPVAEGANSTG